MLDFMQKVTSLIEEASHSTMLEAYYDIDYGEVVVHGSVVGVTGMAFLVALGMLLQATGERVTLNVVYSF